MLRCTKDFRQYDYDYKVGDIINQQPLYAVELWLIDSFPAHFEWVGEPLPHMPEKEWLYTIEDTQPEAKPETRDIQAPPADKAIKRPRGRK